MIVWPAMSVDTSPSSGLARRMGLYTATMIVVGSVVGSGIFKKPAVMAEQLQSPILLLGVWVLAGVVTLCGALTNAEIASMITAVGGQYVFFRRIYNDFIGYLYGWAVFAVIQTASIASIAYVCAEYTGYFVHLPHLPPAWEQLSFNLLGTIVITPFADIGVKLLTVGIIVGLTLVNIRGVALGAVVQDLFTTLKVAALAGIALCAFAFGDGSTGHFVQPALSSASLAQPTSLVGPLVLALSGAFWAYDGWNNVTYVASEVRQPDRSIPRALFFGTVIVLAVYLLINLAYLYILPVERMAGSTLVAADAMQSVFGPIGGMVIALLVVASTFGTANGTILASARVFFAMSRDGLFFPSLGRIHPRYSTPAASLAVQGAWASMLVFTGTFDQLTDMLIFVSWIFYVLGALGVFVLRVREPQTPRPYRVWGYPVVPAAFVIFATGYVVITFQESLRNALLGLLLCGIGVPLYLYWRWRQAAGGAAGD